MASSISSSEEIGRDISRHALPSSRRRTAADRPGIGQPVPERDIRDQPWRTLALTVVVLLIVLKSLWELRNAYSELIPGNFGANYDNWAGLRRQVAKRDVPVVIICDSRVLFDSDLDRAAQLTSVRPLQLAIAGVSGLPILKNLGDDHHFKGLAIVGMAEAAYLDTTHAVGRPQKALS